MIDGKFFASDFEKNCLTSEILLDFLEAENIYSPRHRNTSAK